MQLLAVAPRDRLVRRSVQLLGGLVLYGVSNALLVLAGLGLDPWNVLHQGLSRSIGRSIGTIVVLISLAVLLLWIPLRQRPGVGTVANAVVIGLVLDLVLRHTSAPHSLPAQACLLGGGVILNGVATGLYIGAGLGPGPRDGLSTGFAARGHSLRVVRTTVEVSVLAAGWLLGGTVGVGTVVYALAIGPLAHVTIPALAVGLRPRRARRPR